MEIKDYADLKEAIGSLMALDKEYVLVKHTLNAGEEIMSHCHEKANEWVITDNGEFAIRVGDEQQRFNVKGRVTVICLPKKTRHSLAALSEVSYFVLRDEINEIIHRSLNGY